MKLINILSEVENKFIVKYIEHFIDYDQKQIFIVMEFCDCGDLRKYINFLQKFHVH